MGIDNGITLQKLEVFCMVVQLRSFTRAAQRLGIAQPAVTAHIRHLETKLSTPLMRRQGRSFELTDAGERVYRWARDVLDRSEQLAREITLMADGLAGTITIVATMAIGSYRLPRIVTKFQRDNPQTKIVVNVMNPVLGTEAVRSGNCDFAVILVDPLQRHEELAVELLWHEPLLLVSSPASKHVPLKPTPANLSDAPFVTPPSGLVTRSFEDTMLREQGLTRRNVILEFGHPEAMKQAIYADAAIGFMLASCVEDELQRGALRHVPVKEFASFSVPVFLVRRRSTVLGAAQKSFISVLLRNLGTLPHEA
jgi:DNA-binding transcriptional LysR family regulator